MYVDRSSQKRVIKIGEGDSRSITVWVDANHLQRWKKILLVWIRWMYLLLSRQNNRTTILHYEARRRWWCNGVVSFLVNRNSKFASIKVTLDSAKYCEKLDECLLPFSENKHANEWHFQQVSDSIHSSHYRKSFLQTQILKFWSGQLTFLIFVLSKTYGAIYYRKFTMISCSFMISNIWKKWSGLHGIVLTQNYYKKLARSIPRRCIEVTVRKDSYIP